VDFKKKILTSSKRRDTRIIIALDVTGPIETRVTRALDIFNQTNYGLAAVKINHQLLLPFGLNGLEKLIDECNRHEVPIIADIKLNDVESTNLDAIYTLFNSGVDAVIANPLVGFKEGLGRVIEKSKEMGKGVMLLVYMSHAGAGEGYGLEVKGEGLWRVFAERVNKWDADGAIVSAKSLLKIRETRKILKKDQLIFSPGVGVQGGDAKKAVLAGSDFVIVGRSIIESESPRKVLESLRQTLTY
jgi:orotidine-5'-phosphate decarboxylase